MALKQPFAALLLAAALAAPAAWALDDDMAPLKELAKREAAGGSAGARAMIALLDGGARDRDTAATAMTWLEDAAKRGKHEAQFQLGFQYESGDPPDYHRALNWYLLAAAQGNVMAQSNVASMFLFGKAVPRDPQKALVWSLKAAEQGNAVSQARLGAIYAAGDGVPPDPLKAEYWLVKAARQGYAEAATHLGVMFMLGQGGVERNYPKGLYWTKKAAAAGQPKAKALLEQAVLEDVPGAKDPLPAQEPQ